MISNNLVEMLKQLSTVGSQYLLNDGEKEFDFKYRLRDFDDNQILNVIKSKNPNTVAQLIFALETIVEDKDVQAHIAGFESHAKLNEYIMSNLDVLEEELGFNNYPFDVLEGEKHD